jgi:Ca2+-binding EF-hand superfamily protein
MRYLGAFPTEEELVTEILPQLCADGDSLNIKYRTFEPFMLQTLLEQHYEPDTEETLLQAFRTLDPDGRGYLDEATMMELLTEGEFGFKEKEIEDFMRVAKDPETGLIHFEDYIALLTN